MPDSDTAFLCWLLVTGVASGGWIGWFAGRRFERTKAQLHRMRKRRPITLNVDLALIKAAAEGCGYTLQRDTERLH